MKRIPLSSTAYCLLLAAFFTVFENIALWRKIHDIAMSAPMIHWGVYLTFPLFIFAGIFTIFTVLLWPGIHRLITTLLFLLSFVATYSMYNFGVMIDPNMINNVLLTGTGEVLSYFSLNIFVWFILLAVLPITLSFFVRVNFSRPWWRMLLSKALSLVVAAALVVLIAIPYYKNYAAFGRNHSYIRYLINPTNYIVSTIRHYKHIYINSIPFRQIGTHAVDKNAKKARKNLLVILVGETSRGMNYSLNGYKRNTDPLLSRDDVISFKNFRSCGTATAVSVPCMFSDMTRKNYNPYVASREENLLDVLKHAGVTVSWRDNDEGCKGVCDRIPHKDMTDINDPRYCHQGMCTDAILFEGLKSYIQKRKHDTVIVLHMIGSHGPNYYQRYPKAFDRFTPTCNRRDIQNCSHQALVNTYDNTILYTDYTVHRVIDLLKADKSMNSGVIYLSDHGESLGEKGFYLHGVPYFMAPIQERTVPFIVWLSPGMIRENRITMSCLHREAKKGGYSQDDLFSSVLSLMDIKTKEYNFALDVFSQCSHART